MLLLLFMTLGFYLIFFNIIDYCTSHLTKNTQRTIYSIDSEVEALSCYSNVKGENVEKKNLQSRKNASCFIADLGRAFPRYALFMYDQLTS